MQIIFSPHCDDAVLSLGGAIYNGMLGHGSIIIKNVFTISNYTIMGLGNPELVSQIRHKEETKVMQTLGVNYELWGYHEPLLRLNYASADDIFTSDPLVDPIYGEIYRRVSKECSVDTIYYFPLGIGGHVDHLILHEIGLSLKNKAKVYFYEDQPYSGQYDIDSIERRVKGMKKKVFKFQNVLDKMTLLKNYRSQFDAEDIGFTFWHTLRRGGEVVWCF